MPKAKSESGDIQAPDMEKGQGALQSVTETIPHEADSTSAPNALPDDVNRPPVSTNKPDVPIAHSLVAGAGAPTGPPDYQPSLGPDQAEDYGTADAVANADVEMVKAEDRN